MAAVHAHRESWGQWLGFLCVLGFAVGMAWLPPRVIAQSGASDGTPPASRSMLPAPDIFARPTLPPRPAQADLGSQVYWLHCMVCHGDHGQGLTDAFRAAWPKVDQNCWQAKCHGDVRNLESFAFPQHVPPLIGPGTLTNFQTAADLYRFIRANMPYQAPGSLQDEQYWELTAFLARAEGTPVTGKVLDASSAPTIALRPPPPGSVPWWPVVGGLALLLLGGLAVCRQARRRGSA